MAFVEPAYQWRRSNTCWGLSHDPDWERKVRQATEEYKLSRLERRYGISCRPPPGELSANAKEGEYVMTEPPLPRWAGILPEEVKPIG